LYAEQLRKRADEKVKILKKAENAKRDRNTQKHKAFALLLCFCALDLFREKVADIGLENQQQQKSRVPVRIEDIAGDQQHKMLLISGLNQPANHVGEDKEQHECQRNE